MSPLLSICLVVRNEEYQGDHLYRVRSCLNFLGKGLAALGRQRDVEILVTDWGSEIPLREDLVLLPEVHDLVRFIVVPPALARERQGASTFPYTIACNTAVRRAAGEFIFDLTSDAVLPEASIRALLSVLNGDFPEIPIYGARFTVPRRQLFRCQAERQPSYRELREYLVRNLATLPADQGMVGTVAHRSLWEVTQGLNEQMVHWGWSDVDFQLRLAQCYADIDLGNFGICGVHFQHHTPENHSQGGRAQNVPNDTPPFVANDENWGMAE